VLRGSVERIAERPGDGVDSGQAQLMLRVLRRLERLAESLLDFARVRPPTRMAVQLRPLIEESWTLVRIDREARDITCELDIDADLSLEADADRLGQVWVNLLRNAVDAMGGVGAIRVSAEPQRRDDEDWISISIQDDGPGIDPDVLPRLFEPFTTTRLDSRGTGLGLAVAEGIVSEHACCWRAMRTPAARSSKSFCLAPAAPPRPPRRRPRKGSAHDRTREA